MLATACKAKGFIWVTRSNMALEILSNEHAPDTSQAHPDWLMRTMAKFSLEQSNTKVGNPFYLPLLIGGWWLDDQLQS